MCGPIAFSVLVATREYMYMYLTGGVCSDLANQLNKSTFLKAVQ